jgi:O-acetyl-ADP-ribose deacetylase (regulator of RNase III)
MPHYGDGLATAESIADATRNTLERAEELGATSLVIPALGCGVAGFDLDEGARIICEQILAHEADSLKTVRVIAYSDEESQTIRSVAEDVRGQESV